MSIEIQHKLMKKPLVNYFQEKSDIQHIDYMNHDFRKMSVSNEDIASEWKSALSTVGSLNAGVEHIFEFSPSLASIGNFTLELSLAGAGSGLSWVSYPAFSAIDTVTIYISGREVAKYSGMSMFQYCMFINKGLQERADMLALATGATGANTATGLMYIPILSVGQHCQNGVHNQPFSVGKTSQKMEIRILMRAMTAIEGTSATAVTAFSTMKMWYKRYKAKQNSGITPTFTNSRSAVETYKFLSIGYNTRSYSMTSAVDSDITVNNFIKPQDMVALLILISLNTSNEYFAGETTSHIDLSVQNNQIYFHTSVNEGNMKHIKMYGENNTFATSKYHYCLPTTIDPKKSITEIGTAGLNFYNESPVLTIAGPTTATHYINICALYPMLIDIQQDGNVNLVYSNDSVHPPPITGQQPKIKDGN